MEYLPALATLAVMHLLMAMLPGPNTVVVSWLSARTSRRAGLEATAGVVAGSLVWVVASLFGVGALLLQSGWLYGLLRLLGAAYLLWIGVRLLRAGWRGGAAADPLSAAPRLGGQRPFVAGLLTTLSNPKSAVFWTSAFLVAAPPHAPAWVYATIVAIIAAQSLAWYAAVALLFSTGVVRRRYLALSRWLDLTAGAVMTILGLKIADEVRRELAVRAAG